MDTVYTSRGNSSCENTVTAGINTGFYFDMAQCQTELSGFQFCTGSNADRSQDPVNVYIEGSNSDSLTTGSSWELIFIGVTGLYNVTTAKTCGVVQQITYPMSYKSYRFLIANKRNLTNYVSYSEVKLFGYPNRNLRGKFI